MPGQSMEHFLQNWQQKLDYGYPHLSDKINHRRKRESKERIRAHRNAMTSPDFTANEYEQYLTNMRDIHIGGMDSLKNDPLGDIRGFLCLVHCMDCFTPHELCRVKIDDATVFKTWWREKRFKIKESHYRELSKIAQDLNLNDHWASAYDSHGNIILLIQPQEASSHS